MHRQPLTRPLLFWLQVVTGALGLLSGALLMMAPEVTSPIGLVLLASTGALWWLLRNASTTAD